MAVLSRPARRPAGCLQAHLPLLPEALRRCVVRACRRRELPPFRVGRLAPRPAFRSGRSRWDDRAAILSVIRAPSIASPPDEVDVDGVVSHLLSRSCPLRDGQAPAGLRPTGPSAAMPVTRANAVMPTATAPMTENTNCQVSDGMVCFTMPCVAW